jgi:hypothetical protein
MELAMHQSLTELMSDCNNNNNNNNNNNEGNSLIFILASLSELNIDCEKFPNHPTG